ncbi:hypothetical protein F5Y18DRAFT_152136 [Xylariaceae sp. FL1019]|nr:hypothetical protein F5Y18DRAFT_152136 [Xylariaceae sp. FL1019]
MQLVLLCRSTVRLYVDGELVMRSSPLLQHAHVSFRALSVFQVDLSTGRVSRASVIFRTEGLVVDSALCRSISIAMSSSDFSELSDSDFDMPTGRFMGIQYTNTRETSLIFKHISAPDLIDQFNAAIRNAWPTKHERYTSVHVLIMSWEVMLRGAMKLEQDRLQSVFQDIYGYSVEKWQIPSTAKAQRAVFFQIIKF